MLRMLSFIVAVAAILVIPFSQADARSRGGGFRHGGHGGYAVHHVGRAGFIGHRRAFVGRRHFRGGAFFVAAGPSCWRWWPTAYGYRRVWVCGYPYY
jgi:hypothetical protein